MNSLESLSLETHEITSNAFDVVGDDVYIIIGTKNGNLIVLNT